MGGALMQLIANSTGPRSHHFVHRPKISFYKSVYRRYTNFATEPIEIELNGPHTLPFEESVQLRCTVPRHADLLSHVYLLVDLPAIYSGYCDAHTSSPSGDPSVFSSYRFQWIRELGTQLIERVQVTIGGTKVQEFDGTWIALWYQLFSAEETNLEVFNALTGNVPECYAPDQTAGALGVYPTSTLDPSLDTDPELMVRSTATGATVASQLTNPYYRAASINARTLMVPLPLWFTQHTGAALPLVAMQMHEVQIQITLRPLKALYTIRDVSEASATYGARTPPNGSDPAHAIGSFQSVYCTGAAMAQANGQPLGLSGAQRTNTSLYLRPRLLASYVFLDDTEQSKFAASSHQYLIEQIAHAEEKGVYGTHNHPVLVNHPVKTIVWYAQREDVAERNDWTNYTNRTSAGGSYSSTSLQAVRPEAGTVVEQRRSDDVADNVQVLRVSDYVPAPAAVVLPRTKFDFPATSSTILANASILFNGFEVFATQPACYYNLLQTLQGGLRRDVPGVYTYSFALHPRNTLQPSGACDLSRVKSCNLQVTTVDDNADSPVQYDLHIYTVSYNVLRITNGLAGLEYAT